MWDQLLHVYCNEGTCRPGNSVIDAFLIVSGQQRHIQISYIRPHRQDILIGSFIVNFGLFMRFEIFISFDPKPQKMFITKSDTLQHYALHQKMLTDVIFGQFFSRED